MKRWLWVLVIIGALVGWQVSAFTQPESLTAENNSSQRVIERGAEVGTVQTLVNPEPLKLTVILKQHYIDGVTETTKKEETIWSMIDFWAAYDGWNIEAQELDRVVFQREVKDISPLTKQTGYFGLTKDGELAVFQGIPNEGKVMESFKPVPIKPLESKREKELKTGIKIKDYRHFEQVVQQYADHKEV